MLHDGARLPSGSDSLWPSNSHLADWQMLLLKVAHPQHQCLQQLTCVRIAGWPKTVHAVAQELGLLWIKLLEQVHQILNKDDGIIIQTCTAMQQLNICFWTAQARNPGAAPGAQKAPGHAVHRKAACGCRAH